MIVRHSTEPCPRCGNPHEPEQNCVVDIPVQVSVSGSLDSFNGVPTLWLTRPYSLAAVEADRLTQQVAEMYRRGYVHSR